MPKLATWMRAKDEKWFQPFFDKHPKVAVHNARDTKILLEEMNGLLLTGGPDIAAEFLRQQVPNPSVLDQDADAERDRWEFDAATKALAGGLPIFAICKGMQTLNVVLGGTLHLHIEGHDLPELKDRDLQPLRNDRSARHRFEKVNSSHHQALDRLGEGLAVEAWCAHDDVIEQVKLSNHPFVLGVQYHPERGDIYDALFADFISHLEIARRERHRAAASRELLAQQQL